MRKEDVQKLLDAKVLLDEGRDPRDGYTSVCACDLMSDLLTIMNKSYRRGEGIILLTGLTNPQVVRTAEMVDIRLIVFVRNKKPSPETVETARKCGIALMSTPFTLYKSCGLLYCEDMKDAYGQKKESGVL